MKIDELGKILLPEGAATQKGQGPVPWQASGSGFLSGKLLYVREERVPKWVSCFVDSQTLASNCSHSILLFI